ncbi:MAG: GNAT family N-acetyltransferase, partial [Myxococcales bacterium]|nr:GNAT family N-acetyltransferase [Myxococcales bacterium]
MIASEPAVTLEPIAREQETVLQNLFDFYVYDFSEQLPLEIKPSGRFELRVGDAWWTTEGHFAFFVRYAGSLCGFALVRRGSRVTGTADVMDMAEFFVARGLRRRRIGQKAAHALFRAFPGRWEVRVRRSNVSASRFWARVAESWSGRPAASTFYESEGVA